MSYSPCPYVENLKLKLRFLKMIINLFFWIFLRKIDSKQACLRSNFSERALSSSSAFWQAKWNLINLLAGLEIRTIDLPGIFPIVTSHKHNDASLSGTSSGSLLHIVFTSQRAFPLTKFHVNKLVLKFKIFFFSNFVENKLTNLLVASRSKQMDGVRLQYTCTWKL